MIDRAHLRRTLVTGSEPRQSVQIEVSVLAELLDECDRLDRAHRHAGELVLALTKQLRSYMEQHTRDAQEIARWKRQAEQVDVDAEREA